MLSVAEFLSLVFPPGTWPEDAHVSLWARQTKASAHFPLTEDGLARAAAQATYWDRALAHDVYVGMGARGGDLGPRARGVAAQVVAIPGLWLDVDIAHPEAHAGDRYPPDLEAATTLLEDAFPLSPSVITHSGYGLHALWLLDAPLLVSDADRGDVKTLLQTFQTRFIDAAARRGWEIDNTSDLARVLRVHGTRNHKIADDPRPVVTLLEDGPRYALGDLGLSATLSATPAVLSATPPTPPVAPAPAPPQDVPADPEAARERVRGILAQLKDLKSRTLAAPVLDGLPFAPPGKRDETLQRLASMVAYLDWTTPPAALAEIFRPSLEAMALERPDDAITVADAADKIARAQADAARDKAAEAAANAALRASLAAAVRAEDPDADAPAGAGLYTEAEIARWAAEQGTTPEGFRRRWIIQKKSSFFIFRNGRYLSPVTDNELPQCLHRDLAPAPIEWTTVGAKGQPREKKVPEILREYATVARSLRASLVAQRSYYSAAEDAFVEAVAPLRRLEPTYDAQIDTWLRLLGGPDADKLLDWVATVTRLDRQTCALYFDGARGVGKTMIANGLARLWTTGAPTELHRVLGAWSADMARCPLILADEQIASEYRGQRHSAELRSLIGSNRRTLSRKFMDNADLEGAVRLVLAANNSDLLVFNEDLTTEDLAAVAERFLHVRPDPQARAYLATVDPRRWIEDDRIAKHALWLRDNRTVTPGARFLVEGNAGRMTKLLAVQGRIPSLVVEWLARVLAESTAIPKAVSTSPGMVLWGNGRYLVNTQAVTASWGTYIPSERVPYFTIIGNALARMTLNDTPSVVIRGKKYHVIDPEIVISWAEKHQLGDVDLMRSRVAGEGLPVMAPYLPGVCDA